jgi:hypothetical protein
MIPNLNFYDVYGYLIPGLVLAVLFWLPHGLIGRLYPTADWSSALVAVVVGYVLGHIVQALARNTFPSKTMNGRLPSDALMDKDQAPLSESLKERLGQRIGDLSGIDMSIGEKLAEKIIPRNTPAADREKLRKEIREEIRKKQAQRKDGFLFCRDALLSGKNITYAEQMQGMYALMNGLTMAFGLGSVYHLGWAGSGLAGDPLNLGWFWVIVCLSFLLPVVLAVWGLSRHGSFEGLLAKGKTSDQAEKIRLNLAWMTDIFIGLTLIGSGYALGLRKLYYPEQRGVLLAIAIACAFACFTCFAAYKNFTRAYAETIYRAFNVYEKPAKAPIEK